MLKLRRPGVIQIGLRVFIGPLLVLVMINIERYGALLTSFYPRLLLLSFVWLRIVVRVIWFSCCWHTAETLEATFRFIVECISASGLQSTSKEADTAPNLTQVDSWEGFPTITEYGASLMSAIIRAHGPQLCTPEVARSSAEVALHSAESQL